MILRGIDFGRICGAAGVEGYFGQEYRHHKLLRWFGLDMSGCTFVAKTTTLEENHGNMPMKKDGITPEEFAPKCILPNLQIGNMALSVRMFWECIMLNAVALSGPGAEALYKDRRWQKRKEPFQLSFMPIAKTAEARVAETKAFVAISLQYLPGFQTKIGLQINCSCPNIGLDTSGHNVEEFIYETEAKLEAAAELCVPLVPKFNILAPPRAVKKICENRNCDAICIPNTLLFGKLPDKINWKKLFGSNASPLAHLGGGGLSGPHQLPLVLEWIKEARKIGVKKPINAGSIYKPSHVDLLYNAGASSGFLGAVVNLRPWRVPGIIQRAHQLFSEGEPR